MTCKLMNGQSAVRTILTVIFNSLNLHDFLHFADNMVSAMELAARNTLKFRALVALPGTISRIPNSLNNI